MLAELCRLREGWEANPIGQGRGCLSAKHPGAPGNIYFIHQPAPDQGVVQFSSAFAHNPADAEFTPQPRQCIRKIDAVVRIDPYPVGISSKAREGLSSNVGRGEHDDGPPFPRPHRCVGWNGSGAGHEHADRIAGQACGRTPLIKTPPTISQRGAGFNEGARSTKYGVNRGSEFV